MKDERLGGVAGAGGTSGVTYDLEMRAHFEVGTSVDFSERRHASTPGRRKASYRR